MTRWQRLVYDHHHKGAIKPVDAVARIGRDEFALFLRNREYVKVARGDVTKNEITFVEIFQPTGFRDSVDNVQLNRSFDIILKIMLDV